MICALDTSVIVAALVDADPHHAECDALLDRSELRIYSHALAETFDTLTGGRMGHRVPPNFADDLIAKTVLPSVTVVSLSPTEMMTALRQAGPRGVRGAAIYDYLHLVAAAKSGARRIFTLNVSDFTAFHRAGDPEIVHP